MYGPRRSTEPYSPNPNPNPHPTATANPIKTVTELKRECTSLGNTRSSIDQGLGFGLGLGRGVGVRAGVRVRFSVRGWVRDFVRITRSSRDEGLEVR